MNDPPETPRTHSGPFPPTRWSVVIRARGQGREAGRALDELCRIYWPAVYTFHRRKGNAPADAEDLTQEIFALAMLRLDRLDQLTAFPGWLHGIARHLVYKHWRSSGRRQRHHQRFSSERVDDAAGDDLEARHLDTQRADALRDALETLPDHLREAYVAVDIQQLGPEHAAMQLGITRGNLAVRASRARARIRNHLGQQGWLEESD